MRAYRDSAALARALDEALSVAELRDTAAACVLDLNAGTGARWRSTADIYPASVIKIAIMAEAYARFADGSLSRDSVVRIAAANITPTAEETPLAAGYEATLGELVTLMIERSDNIATNQLIDVLRRERVTASMRALGLERFVLGRKLSGADPLVDDPEMTARNAFPPHEAALLLSLIAADALPGAAMQRALLARCMHNDKLAAGLDTGDVFLHKTGETSTVSHDAGILLTNDQRRYVVVVYTSPPAESSALAAWMRALRHRL